MYRSTIFTVATVALGFGFAGAGQANEIKLSPEQLKRLEIKLANVRPATHQAIGTLPATVICPPNAHVVATAPFSGTVTQVLVLPGERVMKGMPLAEVSSREILEVNSQVAQLEAELQMAEAVAARKREMANKRLVHQSIAAEAEGQVGKLKAAIGAKKRALTVNGMIAGEGGSYTITAPADGEVIEIDAMPGEKIEAMSSVVSVDTSDELWVRVQIPASLIQVIKPGDEVLLASGDTGEVISVGGSLDLKTRSAELYARLAPNSSYVPGQLVSATVSKSAKLGGYMVPSNSISKINNQTAVFVRSGAGFTRTPIELRGRSAMHATIAGSIDSETEIAVSGLPQLEQMLASE